MPADQHHHFDQVISMLRLRLVRHFADGVFGAALVSDSRGQEWVLKVQPRPELETKWTTGAEMAALLHATGYPSPRYRDVGRTDQVVWSLQEPLPGTVVGHVTEPIATQLVTLARRHATDCGQSRPWRDDAIRSARGWLADIPLDGPDVAVLELALDRGAQAELLETTIVHGDFHHHNALTDGDGIVGVFDWDLAGPGDWRFDLVMLAFGCSIQADSCDPEALDHITTAMRNECPHDVLALMTACQILRIASMTFARKPARAPAIVSQLTKALASWL